MHSLRNFICAPSTVFAILFSFLLASIWFLTYSPIYAAVLALLPLGMFFVVHRLFLIVLLFIIFSFFRIHEVLPFLMKFQIPLLLAAASLYGLGWNIFVGRINTYLNKELVVFFLSFVLFL